MNVVVEEADETMFWFELLVEGAVVAAKRMASIMDEGNQLLAIFAASLRTAKKQPRPANDSMTR